MVRIVSINVTYDISIHALLAESDLDLHRNVTSKGLFLSTLSLRRATVSLNLRLRNWSYFYPRSPCGERRCPVPTAPPLPANFYPRSPCGERLFKHYAAPLLLFISIHALLAESDTKNLLKLEDNEAYFYPRSPCGERPCTGRWRR